MTAGYDTLIVTFSDPICVLDRMFADADAWGTPNQGIGQYVFRCGRMGN